VSNHIEHLTTHSIIYGWSARTPSAYAIAAPDRAPLTYAALWSQIKHSAIFLNGTGIGRGDRIAISLPQGPEMAVAFLAISSVAIGAPINPVLSAGDFESVLRGLNPKAILVLSGDDGPVQAAARGLGIPIIEICPEPDAPAGVFTIRGDNFKLSTTGGFAEPGDIGLILPTSGTTSRSKLVPLTHLNFCAAADNTRAALGLTEYDRCLNVMPLFHGHGLVAGVVASILAGATVMCTPNFDPVKFFAWMDEFCPTWFTAVPTIHHAIISEAQRHQEIISHTPLRFIRSASAPLPMPLMEELERVFKVFVTESYGLSEALQLTNTPLDLQKRKVGSLGVPGNSEIAIMDQTGKFLEPGEAGEIVCRGPVVMAAYLNDSGKSESCFTDGWFRTGDIGYLDADGYLYMTGRFKEIINRGGEKVLPQEVDQALMACPAITQAVTFGIPDPVLGEKVASVVVLRPGMTATAEEIREFAAARLSEFKVPNRVLILPSIPTNPTGKLVRREIAERYGTIAAQLLHSVATKVKPRYHLEYYLSRLWEELLDVRPLGVTDDFFNYGGNSLLAARMMEEIEEDFGQTLHPSILYSAPTVEQLARIVAEHQDPDPLQRPLIEIQRGGGRKPFVLLNGDYLGGGIYCKELSKNLDPRQPFYVFSPYGIEDGAPSSIEAHAEAFLCTLRAAQPTGPYLLGGFSHAGLIAYEMARRLVAQGEQVALLIVIDMPAPDPRLRLLRSAITAILHLRGAGTDEQNEAFLTWRYRIVHLGKLYQQGIGTVIPFSVRKIAGKLQRPEVERPKASSETVPPDTGRLERISRTYSRMIEQYIPDRYGGRVTLFSSSEGPARKTTDPTLGWRKVAAEVNVVQVPGNHLTCITEYVKVLAERMQLCIDEVQR